MFDYPEYVIEAFVNTYGEEIEDLIEAFVSRWGNLTIETFVRVLQESQGEEKVLALFAIGSSSLSTIQIREALVPFLTSADRMERWASAYCLGEKKEEQALPVLLGMLEEGLSPQWNDNDWYWYEGFRAMIPNILAEWEDLSLIPALRHALHTVYALEQQIHLLPHEGWRSFQAMLHWALGRYGCFGAVAGLQLRESRLRLAMTQMAWGHLQAHTSYQDLFTVIVEQENAVVKQELIKVLEHRFGLSEEESRLCLKRYGRDSLTYTEESEARMQADDKRVADFIQAQKDRQ